MSVLLVILGFGRSALKAALAWLSRRSLAELGCIAGAVAWKDKGVATANIISKTGAVPAPPPAGQKVPVEDDQEENK